MTDTWFAWKAASPRCPCGESEVLPVGSSPDRYFGGAKDYRYGQCPACGAILLMPEADWCIEEVYPEGYYAYEDARSATWVHRLLKAYFFPTVPPGAPEPVVDFGCGTGLFLDVLAPAFTDVKGIEFSADAVRAGQQAGRPLEQGTWETWMPGKDSVGVLVMNQVIEHLPEEPFAVFEKALDIIKPGGYFILRTPNARAWGQRHFKEFWHPLEIPRHTIIYSPECIRLLAEKEGFVVKSIRFCGRAFDLCQSARYRCKSEGAALFDRVLASPAGKPVGVLLSNLLNGFHKGDNMEVVLEATA